MLVVGLGNPGKSYLLNRHNAGFMALDALAQVFGCSPFKRWNESLVSEGTIDHQKVTLLKPMNFMNLSGSSVGAYARFYKVPLEDIFVFHDDLDIPFGKIKAKQGGSAGGHNGLKSLDHHMGSSYWRVRIGIGRPAHREAVTGYVLQDFSQEEQKKLDSLLDRLASQVPHLLHKDIPAFLKGVSDGC